MPLVRFDEMKQTIKQAFLNAGLSDKQADVCAQIHTEASCDGIFSHGLNRVARFVDYVKKGWVDINAKPKQVKKLAAWKSMMVSAVSVSPTHYLRLKEQWNSPVNLVSGS